MHARSINTGLLVLALTTQCLGQQVKADQGSNQMDGSTWVTLTIPAQTAYQLSNGAGAFTPSFTVRCDSRGKTGKEHRTLEILLDTGGLQPGTPSPGLAATFAPKENQLRLLRKEVLLRIKLDTAKPERRRWELLPSSDTVYRYWGDGGLTILRPKKFLEWVFTTKVLMIEFQPFGQETPFVSEFHPDGLMEEFDHHQECSLN